MDIAIDVDVDAPVMDSLALHARAGAHIDQKIGGPVLDQAGTQSVLDVLAAAVLDDDGVDPLHVQEPRQHQPSGPRTDDADLSTHGFISGKSAKLWPL